MTFPLEKSTEIYFSENIRKRVHVANSGFNNYISLLTILTFVFFLRKLVKKFSVHLIRAPSVPRFNINF